MYQSNPHQRTQTAPAARPSVEPLEPRQLLTAGALDPTFANAGRLNLPGTYSFVDQILVQPDGKILVAGSYDEGTPFNDHFAFNFNRYNPDGSPDPSFQPILPEWSSDYGSDHIALTTGGRIFYQHINTLERLLPDGQPDPTFSPKHPLNFSPAVYGNLLNFTPRDDGRTTLMFDDAGKTLLQLTADGNLDKSFGHLGKISLSALISKDIDPKQLLRQPDGKLSRYRGRLKNQSHASPSPHPTWPD